MKKNLWSLIVLVCFLVLTTTPVYAFQLNSPLDGLTVQNSKLAWQLSQVYEMSITPDQVFYLNRDLAYGEVVLLYGICDASGKSPSDILSMRADDKLPWNDIAKKLDIKLSSLMPNVTKILNNTKMESADADLKTQLQQEKSTPGKAVITPSTRTKSTAGETSVTKSRTYNSKS